MKDIDVGTFHPPEELGGKKPREKGEASIGLVVKKKKVAEERQNCRRC